MSTDETPIHITTESPIYEAVAGFVRVTIQKLKSCEECGEVFLPTRGGNRYGHYCSRKCGSKASDRRIAATPERKAYQRAKKREYRAGTG